jgi:hypothetical protein
MARSCSPTKTAAFRSGSWLRPNGPFTKRYLSRASDCGGISAYAEDRFVEVTDMAVEEYLRDDPAYKWKRSKTIPRLEDLDAGRAPLIGKQSEAA